MFEHCNKVPKITKWIFFAVETRKIARKRKTKMCSKQQKDKSTTTKRIESGKNRKRTIEPTICCCYINYI